MKRAAILVAFALLLMPASVALAEHGEWELVATGPGMVFMDVFPVSNTEAFFSGITQSSDFGMDYMWYTDDQGLTLETIMGSEVTGSNICEMLALFELGTAADFGDATSGVMIGLGFPQSCIDECDGLTDVEAMIHMMGCMFQAGTKVTYTSDAGITWDSVMLEGGADDMLSFVDMVNGSVGYGAGSTTVIKKTEDGGETWTDMPGTGGLSSYVNAIRFVDETLGYIASGNWESEEKSKGGAKQWDRLTHLRKWRTDIGYRFEYAQQRQSDEKVFNADGGVWKTADGGQTWTRLFEDYTQAVFSVSFFDDLHGVILTDKPNSTLHANNAIYYTTDGGETWTESDLPGPLPDLAATGNYNLSDVEMVGKKLVYAMGAADKGFGQAYSLILRSEDGGATWEEDEYNYTGSVRTGSGLMASGWLADLANANIGYAAGMSFERAIYEAENFGPVADAGEDSVANTGGNATLNGTGSYDDNGDVLTYEWTLVNGPDPGEFNNAVELATFVPAEAGDYMFKLTVSDGLLEDEDEVTVTVSGESGDDDDDDSGDDDDDAVGDDDDETDDDDDDDDEGGCCG